MTIRVFLDFKMGCVGCPIVSFHTVDHACIEHGVDYGVLAIRDVVATSFSYVLLLRGQSVRVADSTPSATSGGPKLTSN